VLDPHPRKHGPGREVLARLTRLAQGLPPEAPGPPEPPEGGAAATAASHAPAPPAASAPPELSPSAHALEQRLLEARFEPPLDAELDPADLASLRDAGRAVRVSKTLHYHPEVLAELRDRVTTLAAHSGGSVTLGRLRDELGTSRKFAQALLEHLDAEKVTIRRGDEHVLRRSARRA
jgi:selenocysteine-specific elongation factor